MTVYPQIERMVRKKAAWEVIRGDHGDNIVKVAKVPAAWDVTLAGVSGNMVVTEDELRDYETFRECCVERLYVMYAEMDQEAWAKQLMI